MLKVHTKKFGSVAVLCLRGRFVIGQLSALRQSINSQRDVCMVVLDLAGVTMIDARGLGVMLELREQALGQGIKFKIMNVSKLVGRVLELTCLVSVFEVMSGSELFFVTQGRLGLAACA